MKKFLILLIIIFLALLIDGTLTYDILEVRKENTQSWLILALILILAVIVFFADTHKKPKNSKLPK